MADNTYTGPDTDTWRDPSRAVDSVTDMASDAMNRATDAAANLQHRVVTYFREHDLQDMLDDAAGYVRNHPTQALIAAAAFGFVTAAVLRRR